jgi:polysaccharide export outer membrane protein
MKQIFLMLALSFLFVFPAYGMEYIIGGGDNLNISVWGNPELSVSVPVRPDGKISMPLLGDVKAEGLTPMELAMVIEKGLDEFIGHPAVTVIVTQMNSYKVYVFGNGVTSGEYILTGRTTLLQFLSRLGNQQVEQLQGGTIVTQGPDYYHAYLQRGGKKIKEGFHTLFAKGDVEEDIFLEPGDMIFIPDNFQNNIKVVGSVNSPGVLTYRENLTILDAILAVGGLTEFAKENDVIVVREEKEISVRMKDLMKKGKLKENIILYPGDLIIVKESLF